MRVLEHDALVPGAVYLCQVADSVSCGGCCGLYNVHELRRDSLRAMLLERTTQFVTVARTIAGIDAFAAERLAVEGTDYPDASLHHCPFVGLIIHPAGERVGCLLHPLATGNGGVDWRGLSYYGSAACSLFFCPTYSALTPRWKRLVRELIIDWYSYGLIIVEHRFLAAVLAEVESRLGQELGSQHLGHKARKALADLCMLRLEWPFQRPGTRLGRNFFSIQDSPRPLEALMQSEHLMHEKILLLRGGCQPDAAISATMGKIASSASPSRNDDAVPSPSSSNLIGGSVHDGNNQYFLTILAELDTDPALVPQAVEFLESALEQAVRLCRQIRMF
ncbi:MAG: hypothetical protein GX055_09590 [Desulfovibrionales bacterium]|nr:hypothetical protein [Desulfovibrionales bacterium]